PPPCDPPPPRHLAGGGASGAHPPPQFRPPPPRWAGSDKRKERLQCRCAGADLVGQCRQAEIDALPPVALALPVQRLMLAELLEQDHSQQVGAGKAAWRHIERRRRLRDRLALPARELLAHRLDHLPLARDYL